MENYIRNHAIENVWCNSGNDNQLVVEPRRITENFGVMNTLPIMGKYITLPKQRVYYNVYQIGLLYPNLLNLLFQVPTWTNEIWIKAADTINANNVIIDIYNEYGVMLPKFTTYYMFTNERDLIFAVERDSRINMNFDMDRLYLRFYTNSFYSSDRNESTENYIKTKGLVAGTTATLLSIQNEYNILATKPGSIIAYVNGYLVTAIDLLNVQIGDIVEYVYDASVKRTIKLKVNELFTFRSSLDNKVKYLLHYLNTKDNTIDYVDDIDIHIIHTDGLGKKKGCYYYRNTYDAIRMVTHKDYSIPVDYFTLLARHLSNVLVDAIDLRKFSIEIKIKNSGNIRPLIFDNNRLFELYKLPDDKVVAAMVGLQSSFNLWKAENLEHSYYNKLMNVEHQQITQELVQNAYGYNGMTKVIADTPQRTISTSSRQLCKLPYLLSRDSTIYEYDANGYLLGYHYHTDGEEYIAQSNDCRLIEAITGKAATTPSDIYGIDNIFIDPNYGYKVYFCYLVNNIPNNDWTDVTGTDAYRIENNILIWNNLYYNQYILVRSDKEFLAYEFDLEAYAGTLSFNISEQSTVFNSIISKALVVPMGQLDIFMNGKSLIEGLDYIIEYPRVFIINKKHLNQPMDVESQRIHVRFTGFCNNELKHNSVDDFGFIEFGFLSNNERFDIRDDKILRITVNGSVIDRSDFMFSENHTGVSPVNAINGLPYQVKDIVPALRTITTESTSYLKELSATIDKQTSDYLSLHLPQPDRTGINAIQARYVLISPFLSNIILDVHKNVIDKVYFKRPLKDNEVLNICKHYEYLLRFDPITKQNLIGIEYLVIVPHGLNTAININEMQYRFLTRVVELYCKGIVTISSHVSFTTF